MRSVQPDLAKIVIVIVKDRDLVLFLQQFDLEIPENIGHGLRHALIVWVGKRETGGGNLAVLADDLRGCRSEHRIGVIAKKAGRTRSAFLMTHATRTRN